MQPELKLDWDLKGDKDQIRLRCEIGHYLVTIRHNSNFNAILNIIPESGPFEHGPAGQISVSNAIFSDVQDAQNYAAIFLRPFIGGEQNWKINTSFPMTGGI